LNLIIIKITGLLFLYGSVIHWLIIFGVMSEKAPLLLTVYFHSLAVFNILAGIGLLSLKPWGRIAGFYIAVTQIPAHIIMIYLDMVHHYNSGLTCMERGIDIGFALFYIIYFTNPKIRLKFYN